MNIKSISIALFILLASFVIFSCKNAAKTENNNENNKTEENTESSNDSQNIKVDTTFGIDTIKTNSTETFFFGCSYMFDEVNQIEYKLNGNVKKIELFSYSDFKTIDGKKVPDMKTEWYHFQFHFKPNGEKDWDDLGRISGGGYYYTYKKDSLGRASIKYMVFMGKDSTKIVCSYDDINNTKVETYINPFDNSIVQKHFYYYDMKNNLTLFKSFDEKGNIYFKEEWKYDENNNIISYDRYGYESNELTTQTNDYYFYIFDEKNNWIMSYNYNKYNELNSITVRKITYY